MKMLLAGGGTGGHLFPAVALAEHLLQVEPDSQVLFVGTQRGLEAKVVPELGFSLETIDISGFVGKGLMSKVALLPQLIRSLRQSREILKRFAPDVVVGVGGYASGPMLLQASLKKIPTLIHEQNACPGLTNRLLAGRVNRVCVSFSEGECPFNRGHLVMTGNPVRRGMSDCPPISDGNPTLLVFGGSRGARAINQAVVKMLGQLDGWRGTLNIMHQTGEEDYDQVRQGYQDAGWDASGVSPFIRDMADAYAKAHLVVCRAGATTVAELTACGRPAVLIPYPYAAGDHQSANARALVKRGAALMIPQTDLHEELLARVVQDLLQDRERLLSMAGMARTLAHPTAAAAILQECRTLVEAGKVVN